MPTMKPSQAAALRQDLDEAQELLTNPEMAPYIQDKRQAREHARKLKQTLDEQAPRPYENETEQAKAVQRERELRDEFCQGMPSRQEMHRNRDGSSYKHLKWERANKKKIVEWREITKRLNWDSDDPELTSYEKYRPDRPFGYDTGAQIPGVHYMSPQAKENYPEDMAEPKVPTAVSHLKEPTFKRVKAEEGT